MGSWGSGPLDSDAAWDFVASLASRPLAERVEVLLQALGAAASGDGRLDVEEASGAVVAALLVAAARGPDYLPAERRRILDYASRGHGIHALPDLVGDLRRLRRAPVADLAMRALDAVLDNSELRDLWRDDLDQLAASLDDIRAALRSPPQRWRTSQTPAVRAEQLRRRWVAGTLLSIDLGDGHRSYAQLLDPPYIACYDTRQPATDPLLTPAEIVNRPVLFTVAVNEYEDRPPGWVDVGPLPPGCSVLPKPTTFLQDVANPQECRLVVGGDWDNPVPATQQACIGLERAGVSWRPEDVDERLRCHYAGRPHPMVERLRVRISRSYVRVCTRREAEDGYAAWRFPAPHDQSQPLTAFYPASLLPQLVADYGPGRDDLVMVEVDEAAMHLPVTRRPAIPDDPRSPVAIWTPWISRQAMIGWHDLVPTADGSYKLARPWSPMYA